MRGEAATAQKLIEAVGDEDEGVREVTSSQKSVPEYICYVKSLYRGLLRMWVTMMRVLGFRVYRLFSKP